MFINNTINQDPILNFCIVIEGKACGNISFDFKTDVERFTAEIGYWISREHRNKNIMTNALIDTIDYFFDNNPVVRICADVFDFNVASQLVLQKTGFERIGIKRKAIFKNGNFSDMLEFELIKSKGFLSIKRSDAKNEDYLYLINDKNEVKSEFLHSSEENYSNDIKENTVVIAYIDKNPVGCGSFNIKDNNTIIINNLYVKNEFKKKGIAENILNNLEQWAKEDNYNKAISERKYHNNDILSVFEKNGYDIIENLDTQGVTNNFYQKNLF